MSRQIGQKPIKPVGSTSTSGGSRPGEVAESGNWQAEEYLNQRRAEIAEISGGFLGIPGLVQRTVQTVQAQLEAGRITDESQIEQTTLDQVPPELLENLEPDTLLRFAFSPEDMQALDLEGEHQALADVRNTLTVNNPTPELMRHLVESGQFEDVVWSGHGDEQGMWITNSEGKAELMPAEQVGDMFKDTKVQEMLLNVCNGGDQVAESLADAGVDTFSYNRQIDDKTAIEDARTFGAEGTLEAIDTNAEVRMGEGSNFWERIASMQVLEGGEHRRGNRPFRAAMARAAAHMAGAAGPMAGLAAGAGVDAAGAGGTSAASATSGVVASAGANLGSSLGGIASSIGAAGKAHADAPKTEAKATAPKAGFQVGRNYIL